MWTWVTQNAVPLQSILALVGAIASFTTIAVLIAAWRAASRQAEAAEKQALAARALIEVSELQTTASELAAAAANELARLSRLQMEQSLAPLLVATAVGGTTASAEYAISNQGPGAALDCLYWMGGFEERTKQPQVWPVNPGTLGSGASAEIKPDIRTASHFTLFYRGVDHRRRYTVIAVAGNHHQHWTEDAKQTIGL